MASKVKYEIDLIQVFNRAMSGRPRAVQSKLRGLMNSAIFKQKYGEAVIDEIAHRTEKRRIDKNNSPFFKPYSNRYQNSLEFKIYQKSANNVNLKLTGEMLASMRVGKTNSRIIKIHIPDQFNNDKAHGHINGLKRRFGAVTKGKRKTKGKLRKIKRDFLGLPPEDEDRLLKRTIRDFGEESIINLIDFEKETLEFNLSVGVVGDSQANVALTGVSTVDVNEDFQIE